MENSDDDIDEIQKEIAILAGCNNPRVTKYYGCFVRGYKLWISEYTEIEKTPSSQRWITIDRFIVMEYLGGGSCLDLVCLTTIIF
jgi:serine/threonine-protein kinase 24/25/MST4